MNNDIKLLKQTILQVRNRIGNENAIIRDLRSLIKDIEEGQDVPENIEVTVKNVCRYIKVKYDDVLKAAEGSDNDWESLFKED